MSKNFEALNKKELRKFIQVYNQYIQEFFQANQTTSPLQIHDFYQAEYESFLQKNGEDIQDIENQKEELYIVYQSLDNNIATKGVLNYRTTIEQAREDVTRNRTPEHKYTIAKANLDSELVNEADVEIYDGTLGLEWKSSLSDMKLYTFAKIDEEELSSVDYGYEIGLAWDDMVKYLPSITLDNDVHNDGYITRAFIKLNNGKELNVFYDEKSGEHAFAADYNEKENDICYELGHLMQNAQKDYENLDVHLTSINIGSFQRMSMALFSKPLANEVKDFIELKNQMNPEFPIESGIDLYNEMVADLPITLNRTPYADEIRVLESLQPFILEEYLNYTNSTQAKEAKNTLQSFDESNYDGVEYRANPTEEKLSDLQIEESLNNSSAEQRQ